MRIVEVGPRDGLQNEKTPVSVEARITFIEALVGAGLHTVEVGAFVSPKAIPQMVNSDSVLRGVNHHPDSEFHVLVPNEKGYEAARAAGAKVIAVFASASEGFSRANINCSIAESIQRFKPVIARAKADDIKVRGYISCVLGCPYDGEVKPQAVVDVAKMQRRPPRRRGKFCKALTLRGVGSSYEVDDPKSLHHRSCGAGAGGCRDARVLPCRKLGAQLPALFPGLESGWKFPQPNRACGVQPGAGSLRTQACSRAAFVKWGRPGAYATVYCFFFLVAPPAFFWTAPHGVTFKPSILAFSVSMVSMNAGSLANAEGTPSH